MSSPALSGNGISSFAPKVGDLRILDTTRTTFLIEAKVNMTNPTNYSATVPYVNINMLSNGTVLGYAVARNVKVVPGQNNNILVLATWEPARFEGQKGLDVGRELLSQYISGECFGCFSCYPSIGKLTKYQATIRL